MASADLEMEQEMDAPPPALPDDGPMADIEEDLGEETVDAKPKKRKPERAAAPAVPRGPLAQMTRNEEQEFRDYFESLSGGLPIKLGVERRKPTTVRHNGRTINCHGLLATYDDLIDEEAIREAHGGGTFLLRLSVQGNDGKYKYKKSRTIVIPGEPKIEPQWLNDDERPANGGGLDPAARLLLDTTIKDKERLERKVDDMARAPAVDTALMEMMVAPVREQLRAMQDQNRELMRELREAQARASAPPPVTVEDRAKDKLLDKLIDGDSARIAQLRATHESEIRQLKENHLADVKRLEDRHDRQIGDVKASYEREISNAQKLHDMAIGMSNTTANARITMLEGQVQDLKRENDKLEREVRELREKKDKPVVEQIQEIAKLKKLITGKEEDDDEKEEPSKFIQIAEATGLKSIGEAVAAKIVTLGSEAQPQQQLQLPPVGTRFVGADNQRYMMTPQGPMRLKPPAPRPPKSAPAAGGAPATPGQQQAQPPPAPPTPPIPPEKLPIVVGFLTNAYRRGDTAEITIQSARQLAPDAISAAAKAIAQQGTPGVDAFLDQVASSDPDGELAQQGGRNFLRKIAKVLVGGD